jgi:hypothetical protein
MGYVGLTVLLVGTAGAELSLSCVSYPPSSYKTLAEDPSKRRNPSEVGSDYIVEWVSSYFSA